MKGIMKGRKGEREGGRMKGRSRRSDLLFLIVHR
jgi:hypothetical protein